jgi:tRNA A-37 threonylcarbamoyl transferase component Bud32
MDTVDRLAAGALIGDDFVIERELARGGMGAVYVARQRSTGRLRALKVLQPSLLDGGRHVERFLQEARIGAAFRSAHVVEVIAAGVVRELGTPWMAMELLEGETLARRVERVGPMALPEIAQLAVQLGDALGAAHGAGVVHRDIKPENLFLCAVPSATFHWSLKVLDFGIAKVVQDSRTAATATSSIGTPLWMAPEQTDAQGRIGPATDVWALGLLLFWAHTGRYYWRSANLEHLNLSAVLREMIIDPIEPASTRAISLGASMPPALDPWFARCLDRDAHRRFSNGREACDALLALLSSLHEVPVATPVAFASTTAMPAVTPVGVHTFTSVAATSAPSVAATAFAPAAPALAAAPPLAPASARPPPPVAASADRAPRSDGEARPSGAGTRVLWTIAVLSMLVGLIGIAIALYNEFEFVGRSRSEGRAPRAPRFPTVVELSTSPTSRMSFVSRGHRRAAKRLVLPTLTFDHIGNDLRVRTSCSRGDRPRQPSRRGAAPRESMRPFEIATDRRLGAAARQRAAAHGASKTPVAAVTRSISAGVLARARTEEKSR